MKSCLMVLMVLLVTTGGGFAQGIRTPGVVQDPALDYSVGFGPSAGWVLDNDKWFWGFAGDFGRQINDTFSLAACLAFDQEIEDQKAGNPQKKINTFTGAGTISYLVTERLSLTTGLGLGFLDDDNKEQKYKLNTGDLGTGVVVGYAWPWGDDRAFTISGAYEWNMTERESTLSVDAGISLAF